MLSTKSMFAATAINPGSGLPMVGGMDGVDVCGNSWGCSSPDDFMKKYVLRQMCGRSIFARSGTLHALKKLQVVSTEEK